MMWDYFIYWFVALCFIIFLVGVGEHWSANKIRDELVAVCTDRDTVVVTSTEKEECTIATSTVREMTDNEIRERCIIRENDTLDWYQFVEVPRLEDEISVRDNRIAEVENELNNLITLYECTKL